MVDPGEIVSTTLRREFVEEALNGLKMSERERTEKELQLGAFFGQQGEEIFRGIVTADPRNTG